ncbi:MAG TPA: polysaccharide deacetylase family protein, partial [Candidatus Krumholzibacteria bacterium]|nr:polysaccharide deacetylase family protein [Candidatus Krumholzibacteria bacterium]
RAWGSSSCCDDAGVSIALVLAILAGAPLALHAIWRARYGYPPDHIPRVLCFHKLSRRFLFEGTWTTPERFAAYIDRLRARGYSFIDESQYLAALDAPPEDRTKQIFLTFDDGYTEVHDIAWPLLSDRNIPFHVFLVTDFAGRPNTWDLSLGRRPFRHLDWAAVREMAAGVTFGSHTASHADVTRMSRGDARANFERSRKAIEDAVGKPVRTLSYPYGRYHAVAQEAARAAGFEAAFSLYPSHRNAIIDRFALRRDAVYIIDPVSMIETKLQQHALYGLEEMKCRAINAVAVLTPLLKAR